MLKLSGLVVSPIRRIVVHRHSAFAVVLTACTLALIVWRPWQPRASVTAAPVNDAHAPSTLISEASPISTDDPRYQQTTEKVRQALEDVKASPVVSEPPAKPTILGSWRDDFYGKRIFHFRDDGTAVMTIELDSVGQLLYGPKLTFFIDWTVDGNILKLKMTGGEPKSTATVAKLFGESSEQRIESLEANEMKLRSLDSNKLYTHRRVEEMP